MVDDSFDVVELRYQLMLAVAVGKGVGVETDSGQGRSEPVRQVGGGLSLHLQQSADLGGEPVEGGADSANLWWACHLDPRVEIARAHPVGRGS